MRISKNVFLALAAFRNREGGSMLVDAAGLRRAATASLEGGELTEVLTAIDAKGAVIDSGSMAESDRTLTYAIVTWFSQLGVTNTGDMPLTQATFLSARVLITLGDDLKVPADVRKRAMEATYKLACLPNAERPGVYDFQAVVARLEPLLFTAA